ncbi:hypothetical protein [Actinocorallia longicatena]|uniref:Serine/threonine protein kinase n=1 Tax=Actinocorallia longicatena TaxID=111803 RepID=A0ABP6Q1N0_9ACTN
MKRPTPLITLLAGLVLGGAVLGIDMAQSSGNAEPAPYGAPEATVAAPPGTPAPGPASGSPGTASPGPDPARPTPPAVISEKPVSFAGNATVKGGPVPLAVTVVGNRAIAYLCDGTSLESWFRGSASGTGLDLKGKNGAVLTGVVAADGKSISGKVTAGGGTYPYKIVVAKPPSGLYRATETTRGAVTGWIVQADGRQTGLSTGPDGSKPAPPLDLANLTATVGGTPVTAEPADPNAAP